jgi:hypothetical protein
MPADLDTLWSNADQSATLDLVHREGLSLVGAMRLQFWLSRPEQEAVA